MRSNAGEYLYNRAKQITVVISVWKLHSLPCYPPCNVSAACTQSWEDQEDPPHATTPDIFRWRLAGVERLENIDPRVQEERHPE